MAASDVLKSFLVSIVYAVDTNSEKSFAKSVEGAGLKVAAMGAAVVAAASAAVYAVDKMTERYEALGYMAKRTGSSVKDIQAFQYAMSQMGSTVEDANAALESGSRAMQKFSGVRAQMARAGVDMSHWRTDPTKAIQDYAKILRGKAPAIQEALFGNLGITSRPVMNALMGGLDEFEKEFRDKQSAMGLDPDKTAANATTLQRIFRQLGSTVGIIFDGIQDKFITSLEGPFKAFDQTLQRAGPGIIALFARVAGGVLEVSDAFVAWLGDPKRQEDIDWITNPGTWQPLIDSLKLVGEAFKVIWDFAKEVVEAIKFIAGSKFGQAVGGAIKDDWSKPLIPEAFTNKGTDDRTWSDIMRNWITGSHDGEAGPGGGNGAGAGGHGSGNGFSGGPTDPSKGNGGRNGPIMAKFMEDELRKNGLNPEAAKYGAAALAGNAMQESNGNPTTIHDGGTGYGIYGARLIRMNRMLGWMAQHGYARDSLEGQSRYMAHEAMNSGAYGRTRAALEHANAGNLGDVAQTVGEEFENPNRRLANFGGRRNNAARIAQNMGANGPRIAIPREATGAPSGDRSQYGAAAAALGIGTGGAGGVTIEHHQTNHFTGVENSASVAKDVGRATKRAHADALRDVKSAVAN